MSEEATPTPISRRDAIKKAAVAGAAVGAVWSAPRIEGLSLRPNYAAASSTNGPQAWSVMLSAPGSGQFASQLSPGGSCSVSSATASAGGGFVSAFANGVGLTSCSLNIDRYDASGGAVGGTFGAPISSSNSSSFLRAAYSAGGMLPFPLVLKGNFTCA